MKLTLTLLLTNLFVSFTAYAVDDQFESLSKEEKMATLRLNISNTNLSMLRNAQAREEVNESMGKNSSVSVVAISSSSVFVLLNGVIHTLRVGDVFDGHKVVSINTTGFKLSNGKSYDAL